MDEFHLISGSYLRHGILLGKYKAPVALDDQVWVHFTKELNEVCQGRRHRYLFGQPIYGNEDKVRHDQTVRFNPVGHCKPGSAGCG